METAGRIRVQGGEASGSFKPEDVYEWEETFDGQFSFLQTSSKMTAPDADPQRLAPKKLECSCHFVKERVEVVPPETEGNTAKPAFMFVEQRSRTRGRASAAAEAERAAEAAGIAAAPAAERAAARQPAAEREMEPMARPPMSARRARAAERLARMRSRMEPMEELPRFEERAARFDDRAPRQYADEDMRPRFRPSLRRRDWDYDRYPRRREFEDERRAVEEERLPRFEERRMDAVDEDAVDRRMPPPLPRRRNSRRMEEEMEEDERMRRRRYD
eukprot:PLAT8812.1.p1 GENE.PLAT8812.1~~PLAT8812.1.p1  ORF type:complete len:307 (+),score=134.35 PLAT8812.1:100-921(+)